MHLPAPAIKPFARLYVTDGLLINADRWKLAHDYHRDRQNVHFQSLNQPGIIEGLGVCIIPAPENTPAIYRDGRWIEIQSGLAIDLFGNLIVVPEPINFYVASTLPEAKPLTIYIVISYVDPDQLKRSSTSEIIHETFSIREKNSPPDPSEVELCRILLQPNQSNLQPATNVFSPDSNELDLRYRGRAQSRPIASLKVAISSPEGADSSLMRDRLFGLMQSIRYICPMLQGDDEVGVIDLQASENLANYDLVCLSDQRSFCEAEIDTLKHYFQTGGIVLVEVPTKGTAIEELATLQLQLKQAIDRLNIPGTAAIESDQTIAEMKDLRQMVELELQANVTALQQKTNEFIQTYSDLAQQLGVSLKRWEQLPYNHPLRTQPFLFAALPTLQEQPIQLLVGDGLIVVLGEISSAWALDETLSLPRETIRTAQEIGANLLHYAWKKKQLTQLQLKQVDFPAT
jgi:hypothetical protein